MYMFLEEFAVSCQWVESNLSHGVPTAWHQAGIQVCRQAAASTTGDRLVLVRFVTGCQHAANLTPCGKITSPCRTDQLASTYSPNGGVEEIGSVERPVGALRGHPHLIGLLKMTAIQDIYSRHPDLYLDKLQWFLAIHHDLAISKSALQENLEKAGLTRKVLHTIAAEQDEARRQSFLDSLRHDFSGSGDEFVTVSESSKNDHAYRRCYGCAPSRQDADITAPFIWGQWYSMIAAMSKKGYLAAHIIPGLVDSFAFFDFIVENIVSIWLWGELNPLLTVFLCRFRVWIHFLMCIVF